MLATQWNSILAEDKLTKNGIIILKKYITNSVHNRRIVIIVEVEVLIREMESRIGEPINIEPNQPTNVLPNQRQDSFEGGEHRNGTLEKTSFNEMEKMQSKTSTNPNSIMLNHFNSRKEEEELSSHVFPIRSINPYQNKWTIKARVMNKSEIKNWKNAKGDGRLFNIDLIDDSGEIRATGFNDVVDKFYDMIKVNEVYYISKAQVKVAKRQYSSIRNEYELSLDSNSIIQPVNYLKPTSII
jgi:replication factor A1